MIKAVCAEKAQKLLFSRLEPDRFIIPGLRVSSADSGYVAGLGRCLRVLGGGGKLKVGTPRERLADPSAWQPLASPAQSEPRTAQPSPASGLLPARLPQGLSHEKPVVRGVHKDTCLASHLPATVTWRTSQRAF